MTALVHEFVTVNKGKATFNLHRGQTRAWDSARRFVFVIAGTQGGKTCFGPVWLEREMQASGPGDYFAVTATYDLFKLKLLPELRRHFEEQRHWGTYGASERVIESIDKKTRIILRSADAEGGLESATANAAWLDECGQNNFRIGAWEAVQRRLSLSQGRVLGTTTPYNLGWLHTEVFQRWQHGDPNFDVVQFESIMNPAFPRAEYDRAKATLPTWKFEMFYRGNFSRPAGQIYGDFSDDHIIDDFGIPAEWPRYVGIDFGAVNTATVWIAHDVSTESMFLYRATLEGNMSTDQHVAKAQERSRGERVVGWYGGSASETQQRWDWGAAGLGVQQPAIGDVEAAIDRVISLLKQYRLFVFRSCVGMVDEFHTYSRVLDDRGQPTEKIQDKETFHLLDALRYVVGSIGVGAGIYL